MLFLPVLMVSSSSCNPLVLGVSVVLVLEAVLVALAALAVVVPVACECR